MATGLHAVIDAVPARVPNAGTSLIECALPGAPPHVNDTDGITDPFGSSPERDRWQNGVEWRPYTDSGVGGAYDPCNVSTLTPGTLAGKQTSDVFVIWEAESCTTLSDERFIAEQRARAVLEATTSKKIAKELWRGDIAQAAGWSNRRLNNPTAAGNVGQINGGSAVNRVAAFAALEQALGEQSSGAPGYIHCTRRTLSYWVTDRLVERVGSRMVSRLGTTIIADAGYDGTGSNGSLTGNIQNGTQAWAYATGPVRVWTGDVVVQSVNQTNPLPDISASGDRIAEVINRSTNLLTMRAYRNALAVFDSTTHVGVLVDHTNASTNNAQTT